MAAVVLVATLTAAGPLTADGSTHVRPRSRIAQAVVDDAVRASPTVETMIAALEHTDVFVYVDARFTAPSWRGGTRLVGAGVASRFVEVTINLSLARDHRAEVLGHELQHVLEIAGAPDVRDPAGMKQLFDRIGWRLGADYETAAAIDIEHSIHEELWSRRARR